MSTIDNVDKVENLEFKWIKKRGVGGRRNEYQFYESFRYDGTEYALYDCVYIYKDEEPEPYIGKLIKIWEALDKSKKIKILWFFRPSEISNWLGDEQSNEKELFLASGEGLGLANVNILEAIAGKCNVLCTSEDCRNPQPLPQDFRDADFFFRRTFDVGQCKILDRFADKIAGVEVKFLFNRTQSSESKNFLHHQSDRNKDSLCAVKRGPGHNSVKEDAHLRFSYSGAVPAEITESDDKRKRVDGKATLNSKFESEEIAGKIDADPLAIQGHANQASVDDNTSFHYINVIERPVRDDKTTLTSKVDSIKSNKTNKILSKQGSAGKEDNSVLDGRPLKKAKVDASLRTSEDSGVNDVPKFDSSRKNLEMTAVDASQQVDSRPISHSDLPRVINKSLARRSAQEEGNFTNETSVLHDRLVRKENANASPNTSQDKGVNGSKTITVDTSKKLLNSKLSKDSHGRENSALKRPESSNEKLLKASTAVSLDDSKRSYGKLLEVTRRPNADSSRWFKGLPWEERMQVAHKQGKIILLENLDPAYTSAQVEDIIWHGFGESCTAKMIHRKAMSSPHSGQAFVVFNTREITEMVIAELDHGCFMLSNGRPLIARIASTNFPDKHPSFTGHMTVDTTKFSMQRAEMKQAVSTSHCSQPNTIEYEMAMEWCLLQDRSEICWKDLYKVQGKELTKLKAELKFK